MRARWLAAGIVVAWCLGTGPAAAGGGGPWVWPLTGPRLVSRGFDPPPAPYAAGHRGADLVAEAGSLVRAAGAGRVSYAGLLAGRGVVVVVHGELRTTYEPVLASVRVGQLVAAGDPLGRLVGGHPGCVAACLHWGLLRGDTYLDPVRLVARPPVRLLPLEGPMLPTGRALTVPVAPSGRPATPVRPADAAPEWSVRSWATPSGAGILLALLLGIAVLRRPGPRRPGGAPAASQLRPPAGAPTGIPVPLVVDLRAERARRRGA